MRRAELKDRLIDADGDERLNLFANGSRAADVQLAIAIRNECIEAWSSDPERVARCVAVAKALVKVNRESIIRANSDWTNGIGEIVRGRFESAVTKLERAYWAFQNGGNEADAAQTNVAKLLALAMLGRYDDAIVAGLGAIPILTKHGDELAAGKIEMNLSNIVARRSQHREALEYCDSARRRFIKVKEPKWQAMAENGLANTYAELNEFAKAEQFYKLAFKTAVASKMHVTEAEIEASMGNLALFRGQYADALRHLELSRRKFEALSMPHQTAIADLEIADIYGELNLNAEAVEIYERVCDELKGLKLRSEEARSRKNYARVLTVNGTAKIARKHLKRALKLYTVEKNLPGQAAAMLAQARSELDAGDCDSAIAIAEATGRSLKSTQDVRLHLTVGTLKGEAYLAAGNALRAKQIFESVLVDANRLQNRDAGQIALKFLGKIAVDSGEIKEAIKYFKRSISIVERLRTPLAAEEFSMSFMAARLEPYDELAQLYLAENRVAEAFQTVESGRSRALVDALDREKHASNDSKKLSVELVQVREELNSFYKRLDRADADEIEVLDSEIRKRETFVAKLTREIASVYSRSDSEKVRNVLKLKTLKQRLGDSRSLIEFIEIDGWFSAFVVTGKKIRFIRDLATVDTVAKALEDLHFQFGALRYGTLGMERFIGQMKSRADACLANLYQMLVQPLEKLFVGESLVIVPAGLLNYVPFHGLYDGEKYMVERTEVSYAPSAAAWTKLQDREPRTIKTSLLMGFADERIPLVEREIEAVRRIVPRAKTLIGENASFSAFAKHAPNRDLIHLACHGHFRAENPMFSSLHLADGWITVRDICDTRINAELVVLSACETGLNKVFAGDEILGLARGFLTAGAASLIVSLWTVNDAASALLMQDLYREIQRGHSPAASLRKAQQNAIGRGDHPYLWSPFLLIGR